MFCIKLIKRRQDLNSIYSISLWVFFLEIKAFSLLFY